MSHDPLTANFRTVDDVPPSDSTPSQHSGARRRLGRLTDPLAFSILAIALLILYGLLQNPYWVPAGDSELYTTAARNMAGGHGYTFNGQPIAIIPPGWSWMMSIVMRICPYFLPLKLLAMTCMTGSLLMGYAIVRRFVAPGPALAVILITAILSHMYQATYWLISESAFCLASSASLLLAMQIAEGRRQMWRVALLAVVCVLAVIIRFAGVLGVMLVVAALLDRELRPRLTAPWIIAAIIVASTGVSFFALRHALSGTPQQNAANADVITGAGEDTGATPPPDTGPPITGAANQSARAYHLFPTGSYADRFLNWGKWFSYLYWQPFRAAGGSALILAVASLTGWTLIAVLAVLVVASVRRKKWLWLATGAYTGVLAIGWTNVNARYYVPVAFLITLAVFLASDELTALAAHRPGLRRLVAAAFVTFIGSVAICNGALYTVEMAIARSDHFYGRYEDGLNMSLIGACQYLNALPDPPKDGDIGVSQRYTNLNRPRASPFGLRATALLTGREIVTPRFADTVDPPNSNSKSGRALRRWLKSKGIRWYLYQPPISPWRVWHFRLGWYEKWQTGQTAEKDTAGWQLYRVSPNGDDWIPVRIPSSKAQPVTRVPGL